MRIKMVFSYDGSKFNGFQRQKSMPSIQGTIESALSNIYNTPITIKGAGRTDAGVHANNQVAHFNVEDLRPNLKEELNNLLRPSIYVKNIKKVDDDFHARKDAKKKEYVYKINLGPFQSSLNDYYYQPNYQLDVSLMKDASKVMLGTHDFHNFVAGFRDDYVSTIHSITITKTFQKLEITFVGVGFYRYMVRNLVGALLEVGKYKIDRNYIKKMLDNPDEELRLPTAPPQGLYLNKIWY
ncbi:MAG: tRNA pseudouridine(38-40) synthase TruA [Bacilli bacterium]|nr:tRNA pseudouridine(38-40) synthase TruA [Bacilli bacterium]